MIKSYGLYNKELCKDCLKKFDEIMIPFKNLNYEWEEIDDLKARHKLKLMMKIGQWQKNLCNGCMQRLLIAAKKKDDPKELHGMAQKFHAAGSRRKK